MSKRNFHEVYWSEKAKPPSPRGTGFVFASVAAIVALIWHGTASIAFPFAALAIGLILIRWRAPALLAPLHKIWFRFGLLL
ncbi:MAG: hypothetical protein AAF405_08670, partial [Pseudomonadota bacterium]